MGEKNKNLGEYQTFFASLEQKFKNKGFEIKRNTEVSPYQIDVIASKDSWEASKFGKMTRIIMVASIENTNAETILNFSMRSFQYALDNRDSLLPRGLGGSLLFVPVIVSNDFNIHIKLWMEKTLAEKHWAAFEFPVLISLKDRKIYYCKKTPIWGAAYYRGFRKFVEENLSF